MIITYNNNHNDTMKCWYSPYPHSHWHYYHLHLNIKHDLSVCAGTHIDISIILAPFGELSSPPPLRLQAIYIYIYVNVAYKHTSRHISSRSILKRHCLETSGRFRLSKRAVIWDRPWPSATHTWARTHRLEPTDVYICTFVHLYTWSDVLSAVWHERTRGLRTFPSSPLEHRWRKKLARWGKACRAALMGIIQYSWIRSCSLWGWGSQGSRAVRCASHLRPRDYRRGRWRERTRSASRNIQKANAGDV